VNEMFEQGPIRPPSEARSLLIRVTRNCPWNKCAFCHTYRGTAFSLRSVAEIKEDITRIGQIADQIRQWSWQQGDGGRITDRLVNRIYGRGDDVDDGYRSVAAWLYFGATSVFLQDANSLIMKTDDLAEVLTFIKTRFPSVGRITTYARSHTAARRSVEELGKLREAGLTRIHIGMESGYDPLLAFIRKGVTAADHVTGGQRIVAAGISLSEYVMPGLGGRRWSREHALATADAINRIDPEFVRLRTLHVVPGTDLHDLMTRGEFEPLSDEEILREIRCFIEALDGIETTLVSDHILNLLEELEGKLPEDKARLLATVDRYFALSEEDRRIFRLGRRRGVYRCLDDLADGRVYRRLQDIVAAYHGGDPGRLDQELDGIMNRYI